MMERLRQIRADAEAAFSRLAPRERLMVGIAAATIAAFILFIVSFSISRTIGQRESRIDEKTKLLAEVGKLTQGYRAAEAERMALESRLMGTPTQLISFITQIGTRLGVSVDDLRNGPSETKDKIKEDSVEVNLPKMELPKLARLLEELERGSGVIKVTYLRLSTTSSDPNVVDVTLRVATYQKI